MKLHILSDLHCEFADFAPPVLDCDVVVLAGDIHVKSRGARWASESFKTPVLYVMGNHEHYGGNLDRTYAKLLASATEHVHILENQVWEHRGVQFLCATGWTSFGSTGDVGAAAWCARDTMNDFRTISVGDQFRRLRPDDLIARNRATKAWLEEQLSRPFQGKRVVVSHHAPLMQFVTDQGANPHLRAAYGNDWDSLMCFDIDLWIFGHTHKAIDEYVNGIRFISNPRGYPSEQTGFRPELVVNV
ncbi:metallophosphoesterase [Pseudomonas aeruginosa]|uniref:metallophosphoesterase n=1 Tax=Pseudomonas aeruginosa TaxID=287 RepID=UPI000F527467|nr:metallophosphoesterase [Pseudomonas aeruginosa]EKX6243485.1 metallophosphoesterase [Pseudomonas aeruginosa]RQH87532.1 serine/threonine protein phosphatase [Pseudomonas aeruginosa]HBP0146458.1 serine/threonine protein phosphatase [Pseudomonas aeruginosa]